MDDKILYDDLMNRIYDNNIKNESFLLGASIGVSAQVIFILINIMYNIMQFAVYKKFSSDAHARVDNYLTQIIRDITNNQNIVVKVHDDKSPQAWSDGSSSLAVTTGLTRMMSEKELIAILLHEYAHYDNSHGRNGFLLGASTSMVFAGIVGGIAGFLIKGLGSEMTAGVTLFLAFCSRIIRKDYIELYYGRVTEYDADSTAAKYGYGKEMISALYKLEKYVKSIICKDVSSTECEVEMKQLHKYDEHPTLANRIKNILKSKVVRTIASIPSLSNSDATKVMGVYKILKRARKNVLNTIKEDDLNDILTS